ncbi:MAG: ATP-binding cassette domain-containing protein [Rhodospirillum sp.]|nr:ATP-binding cassette domain-containing protein [Rhodospirillum sp.]MCF8491453.1 ATP-binding cassette domain-containing protein [Rhodospirillum sp.]MCF8498861.1 ATP-binding cassette domain-containing protein [Rhodospirillum sp.]
MSRTVVSEEAEVDRLSALPKASLDLLVTSLFLNILSLALPIALLQVYDRIVPNSSFQTLALLVAGVLSALALEALLRIGRSYATGWSGAQFEHRMGNTAFGRLLGAGLLNVQRKGAGVLLEQMSSLKSVKEYYGGQAATSLLDLPFVFIFLGVIWYLGGVVVLVPVVVLVIFALVASRTGLKLRKAIEEHSTANDRKLNFIIEVLGNVHTVKSMAMESLMMRRFERLQETSAASSYEMAKRNAGAIAQGGFFSQITMVLVSSVGALLVMDNDLTIGQLAACTLLAGRAMQPLQRVVGLWTRFQTIQLGRERVKEILSLPTTAGANQPPLPDVQGRLTLRDVHFRYGDDEGEILRGIDLDIAPGQCIGVVGANGSGKTTLLSVVMGVLPPSRGQVLIDGMDLMDFDSSSFKRQIGYLPQEGELFKGTILENISMFDSEYRELALRAADDLGLTEVVAALPMGFETIVGDGAYDTLPTGLRQRVCIARALLHDPKVILFDEANASVDKVGDTFLMAALDRLKGDRTMIVISQRPSLLRMTDRVYQLSMGTLVERSDDDAPGGAPRSAQPLRRLI